MEKQKTERIDLIDAMRGLALLGLLWVNLPGHAFSFYAVWDPTIAGGTGLNISLWTVTNIFIDGTMRGLFSFLFGVGAALQFSAGISLPRYYLRYFWLILFGAFHGIVLLMPGDVLLAYGVVAFFLFPLKSLNARGLVSISIVAAIALAALSAIAAYETSILGAEPLPIFDNLATASYFDVMAIYAPEYAFYVFSSEFIGLFLDACIMMTLGMAVMHSDLFSINKPRKLVLPACAFFIISICLRIYTTTIGFQSDFSGANMVAAALNEIARPLLTLSYVFAFIIAWKSGILKWAADSLIALGRMALTNYLTQTIIATFIFYGYGLGLFGNFTRLQLIPIIVGIWIMQTFMSRLWMGRFSRGPVEVLWRYLSNLGTGRPSLN